MTIKTGIEIKGYSDKGNVALYSDKTIKHIDPDAPLTQYDYCKMFTACLKINGYELKQLFNVMEHIRETFTLEIEKCDGQVYATIQTENDLNKGLVYRVSCEDISEEVTQIKSKYAIQYIKPFLNKYKASQLKQIEFKLYLADDYPLLIVNDLNQSELMLLAPRVNND